MKQSDIPNTIQHVALYIRVSSDEQAENGDSIRDQQERGTKYIDEHKNMILQDIYIDDGVSGQKLDRDDFTRLLNNVKSKQVDLIIFTKLDRWFRNLRHYLNTQAILEKCGAAWTAIDQPYFDTSTPYGRAFVAQSMTWAELEAQNGGQRVRDVFKTKVQHGEAITGKVPRGYEIKDKHLVLSEEAPAIHDSIMFFLRTQSLGKTILYMKEKHGIVMTLQNLRNSILRNEKLVGRYRDENNYCPRIISDKDYEAIQRILDSNSSIRTSQKYPYIFSGLLVCNECGYRMTGCHINVLSKRVSGKVYRYKYPAYECRQYRSYHKCDNGGEIREIRIEEYLLENVRKQLGQYIAGYSSTTSSVVDNRAAKNRLRKKLDRLKDLYLNEVISISEYKVDRANIEAQLEAMPDIEAPKQNMDDLQAFLNSDFEMLYKSLDNEEKRLFWRAIIREIRVSKSEKRHRNYEIIFL